MDESLYARCHNCGEGRLLPFFDTDGTNIYVCTKCLMQFGNEAIVFSIYNNAGQRGELFGYYPRVHVRPEE
ncbi:MAG: hypothetical protein ACP5C4_02925 [Methanomicrobiales archaeon]